MDVEKARANVAAFEQARAERKIQQENEARRQAAEQLGFEINCINAMIERVSSNGKRELRAEVKHEGRRDGGIYVREICRLLQNHFHAEGFLVRFVLNTSYSYINVSWPETRKTLDDTGEDAMPVEGEEEEG